ncbi:MAG: HEPN domain-containing protein [Myxococcales bacterium]|nr:HEPN domain-containing protein [Myxococcales bacterium]
MSHDVWLEQAADDLKAACVLSGANHHSQAVWLAAQSVEKAHKAILAALGLQYEEKHDKHLGHGTGDISKLLPDSLQAPRNPNVARMIESLETPAQVAGLKGLMAPATRITSSQQEIGDATELLTWCRERVTRADPGVQAMRPQ